jgi:hypothetical protein
MIFLISSRSEFSDVPNLHCCLARPNIFIPGLRSSLPGGYLENGDVVSLKSPEFNKYVVAEDNGSCNADRGSIGDWEKFTVYFN